MGRFCNFSRARLVALAFGAGVLGSLALAPATMAVTQEPPAGANCQPDGKISGAGSTFQANGINNAFTFGYQRDVCGEQTAVTGLFGGGTFTGPSGTGTTFTDNAPAWTTDPSLYSFNVGAVTDNVAGMVAYNYSNGTATNNGSGAGLIKVGCRMDMFGGTDIPYNTTQITALKAAPGDETAGTNAPWNASPFKCDTYTNHTYTDGTTTFAGVTNDDVTPPPYGPQSYGAWPAAGDTTSPPMSFPIAGGAVAFVANLNGVCTTQPAAGTQLNLTGTQLDDIMQGTINQWNDSALAPNNTFLATDGCSGNIQRVVRQDNSGTTAITMFTLNGYDTAATLCNPGSNGTNQSWYADGSSGNNTGFWPAGCTAPDTGTTAPNAINNAASGSPALISTTEATNGGFGYAETGLWGTPPAGDIFVALPTPATQNNSTPTFILPGNPGAASNCALPTSVPTGSTSTAAVGLATTNWSNTGTPTAPGKQDVADPAGGTGYPACGLTFDLVYTAQRVTNEIAAPAGSLTAATAGCTIPAAQVPATQTTAVDNPAGATSLTVPSTAGYPTAGSLTVNGTTTIAYTGVTATTFTGVTIGADIPSGSTVALQFTHNASTGTRAGLTGQCLTVADSVSGITNDQLRTLYSYFSYMLSPLGQNIGSLGSTNNNLQAQTLDPLPASWIPLLEQGFQNSF